MTEAHVRYLSLCKSSSVNLLKNRLAPGAMGNIIWHFRSRMSLDIWTKIFNNINSVKIMIGQITEGQKWPILIGQTCNNEWTKDIQRKEGWVWQAVEQLTINWTNTSWGPCAMGKYALLSCVYAEGRACTSNLLITRLRPCAHRLDFFRN